MHGTKVRPSYANLFATSSTREDLTLFITAVNSFHPALEYKWKISNSSLAFLEIKVFN